LHENCQFLHDKLTGSWKSSVRQGYLQFFQNDFQIGFVFTVIHMMDNLVIKGQGVQMFLTFSFFEGNYPL